MGVTSTVSWLSVGLYGGGAMSDVVLISTGAPQLTVLSPFLFTFHCWEKKCSDDAAVGVLRAGWNWSAGKKPPECQQDKKELVGFQRRATGVHLNGRLGWRTNIGAVYEQGMSRLCFRRKLSVRQGRCLLCS